MTDYSATPPTKIATSSEAAYAAIRTAPLSVLCGRNNSGKSFLLRKLVQDIGQTASYLGPARYFNFNVLAAFSPRRNRKQEKWNELLRHLQNQNQNIDNSPMNLAQAIAELTDTERSLLFELVDRLLSSKTDIKYTVPENSMSQKYIAVDDYNLAFTSTGFRLVTTLLTSLLDTDYQRFLIDEPELGLSPEIQGIVADFIFAYENRKKYFPHIEAIVLATHSPIFLDRKTITNNYFVDRLGPEITIRQLTTVQDLNSLQFYLLGNRFESLFLPSAIILVEGICDYDYVKRLVALRFPNSLISVIQCNGDSRIRDVVHIARQMLSDIRRSPYADRIYVILDKIHGQGLVQELEDMGITKENIIVWDSNGIEFVYPHALLEKLFGSFTQLKIDGDNISANGITVRKRELSNFVGTQLSLEHKPPEELENRFLSKLEAITY